MIKALIANGIQEQEAPHYIIDSKRLSENPIYLEKLEHCFDLFNKDKEFQAGCLSSSKWVLKSQLDDDLQITEEALFKASKYFLAELPLFLWGAEIMESNSALFCYHNCPDFLKHLFTIRPTKLLGNEQGFSVIKPKWLK
jgi:cyclo(L-tyrosyl-L-tyrosyl) synthase